MNGMSAVETNALATTNYSTGSTTIFQSQDGYTAGFLQNISVDRDGVNEALGFEPSYNLRKGLEEVIQADFTPSKRSNRNPSETKQKT